MTSAPHQLTFACRRGVVLKQVGARAPESACKKAYRAPAGRHWEQCPAERAEVVVTGPDGGITSFELHDNG